MKFSKLHGAGNDFLIFDGSQDSSFEYSLPPVISRLCNRHTGVGADGVLLVTPIDSTQVKVQYWNSDGSLASFCGNGTRCAARFAQHTWGMSEMTLHTDFVPIPGRVSGNFVVLYLPAPAERVSWREFQIDKQEIRGCYVVLGVPHFIVPVDWPDFRKHSLAPLAPTLRSHPQLPPDGANVTFMQRRSMHELDVRSWERGVEAETLACASGAVCAALIALSQGWCEGAVRVLTASGRYLEVTPLGIPPDCGSSLAGPAEWIADGTISPELFV